MTADAWLFDVEASPGGPRKVRILAGKQELYYLKNWTEQGLLILTRITLFWWNFSMKTANYIKSNPFSAVLTLKLR